VLCDPIASGQDEGAAVLQIGIADFFSLPRQHSAPDRGRGLRRFLLRAAALN
jgi:hypothetical protein